ncbi:PqiC family protein [Oleiagrimonas sp.]|jgi:uncharacterized lipoprotein YmbA|uniref:PqiC family protein n=1 Tax=Oleiagrimonas sp. TaxID=2010330 RepID=UPI00262E43CA|nr:PqiC family protein [Oleiagrimonas sp.]MDA3913530.1 PqiC family protein [Oleiagrimonas sp.]
MKRNFRYRIGLGLCLLLAACSSAPMRFYTLVPQGAAPVHTSSGVAYRFALLPVTIPAAIDQPQLVIRQSDDRMAVLDGERWIAPVDDQIRSAVSDQLQRRLDTADVYGLPNTGAMPVYRIKLDVQRFESVPGQYASIAAGWSVRSPGGTRVLACTSRIREPVDTTGYGALVRGHQRALQVLADHIATTVQQLAQGGHADCPAP